MKIITNKTLYRCEYCKKVYQVGAACKLHEIKCTKNPDNVPRCADCCDHLETREKSIDVDVCYGIIEKKVTSFYCKAKQVGMYPSKAHHKGLVEMYPDTFEGEIRMPKECDLFEYGPPF